MRGGARNATFLGGSEYYRAASLITVNPSLVLDRTIGGKTFLSYVAAATGAL
jgi:hypothetical protein